VPQHRVGHHALDPLDAAVLRDLPQERRVDERVRRRARQEHGLDAGDGLVHLGHLELVLEVGRHPEALDDHVGADLLGEIDDEHRLGVQDHGDAGEVPDRRLDHLAAHLELEQRLLARVAHRGHQDVVEQALRRLDDLEVPVVKRIERAGEERRPHEAVLARRATVTTVLP
jgi:hypothetical protein